MISNGPKKVLRLKNDPYARSAVLGSKYIDTVRTILKNELGENASELHKANALRTACLEGKFEKVKLLVNEFNADVNHKCQESDFFRCSTPLQAAIHAGSFPICQFLIQNEAKVDLSSIADFLEILSGDSSPERGWDYLPILELLIQSGATLPEHMVSGPFSIGCYLYNLYKSDMKLFEQMEALLTSLLPINKLATMLENVKIAPSEEDNANNKALLLSSAFAKLSSEPKSEPESETRNRNASNNYTYPV